MHIEVLIRWTEVRNVQEDEDAAARRIIDGEESLPRMSVRYDYSPMVVNIADVARFNRSNDVGHTTLRFTDGDSYVIKYDYENFMDLYIELTGKTITSCLPEDYQELDKGRGGDTEGYDQDEEDDDIDI